MKNIILLEGKGDFFGLKNGRENPSSSWFTVNYLQVNATKIQAMTLSSSRYTFNFLVDDASIEIGPTLKILGVTLDRDLSFKPNVTIVLKKHMLGLNA